MFTGDPGRGKLLAEVTGMRSNSIVSLFMSGPWLAIPLLIVASWVLAVLLGYGAWVVVCWVFQAVS